MDQSTTVILMSLIGILIIWLSVVTVIFLRTQKQLKDITKGVSKKDLRTILTHISNSIKTTGLEISDIKKDINALKIDGKSHFQKLGCVRFNPFSDTGGNQSFSLCLLDDLNSGIVITSLHSRDATRIYTKEIKKGLSDGRELSKEEQQAVKLALKEQTKG